MTAIEFLRRYRPNSLVKSSARGEYQLAEHDSFKINGESSVWHWKSRDIGGKSALKYLIYVEGVPFVEAVQLLCEESPMYIPVQHETVERERPSFRLPNPALNNDRVTRYLLGRGISLPTIRYCIERKILYESAEYHNCVFLGKDPQGVPKYAALRGIYDYGKYQAIVTTHLNTKHYHNHIVWSAVSLEDGKKYHSNSKSYYTEVRALSDALCQKYGLSIIETPESLRGKRQYEKWRAEENNQPTWRTAIRQDVDDAIQQSLTWRQFLSVLERKGYEVRMGRKYPVLRPPGKERFVRFKTLGKRYLSLIHI